MTSKLIISQILLILFMISGMIVVPVLYTWGSNMLVSDGGVIRGEDTVNALYGTTTSGQSFVATNSGLSRIDIRFATYARKNTNLIDFYLIDRENNTIIRHVPIDAKTLKDTEFYPVKFDPVLDSEGKSYYMFLKSDNGDAANTETIWYDKGDSYKAGNRFQNNLSQDGDLCFVPYYSVGISGIFGYAFKKLQDHWGFLLGYGIIFLLILYGILIFRKTVNLADEELK